jgi:hypothetical protein
MSAVSEWHLFCYMNDEEFQKDEHRMLAEWQLQDAVRWAQHRGYDCIMLTRTKRGVEFVKHPPSGVVVHY